LWHVCAAQIRAQLKGKATGRSKKAQRVSLAAKTGAMPEKVEVSAKKLDQDKAKDDAENRQSLPTTAPPPHRPTALGLLPLLHVTFACACGEHRQALRVACVATK